MKITLSKFILLVLVLSLSSNLKSQIITPKQNGNKYSLEVGGVYFEVDASYGARITSFKLDSIEFLSTKAPVKEPNLWGSTIWMVPWQSDNSVYDTGAYTAKIENSVMRFVSKKGMIQVIKAFSANAIDTSISLKYSLVNTSNTTIKKALWEVTRTAAEGLTFWPQGKIAVFGDLANETQNVSGYTWMLQNQTGATYKKFKADGSEGWYAHATQDKVLFIKTFKDVLPEQFANDEGEIEYWVHTNYAYIELENQSPYVSLKAGDTLHYEVKWYLTKIPDNMDLKVGNTNLADYVKNVIKYSDEFHVSVPFYNTSKSLDIYPNPVSTTIRLQINSNRANVYLIEIYNLSGKLVLSANISADDELDVSTLSSGIYNYSVKAGSEFVKGKLIKL